jgi:4-hydroxy-tetrahydrodipicolinate synthase
MTLTALITPFTKTGEIDWMSLQNLLRIQLSSEIDGIIGLCTTSETPTLSNQEQLKIAKFILNINQEYQKQIWLGVSGSATNEVKQRMQSFENLEIDGFLISTPSYNKPPQEGMIQHFLELDNFSNKNIILYNVPGRTGVNLHPESVLKILQNSSNIVGIKEACGDLSQIQKLITLTKANFSEFMILSGDDSLTVDIIRSGGDGVVSVSSNLYPNQVAKMVETAFFDENTSRIIEAKLSDFFEDCFIETNPIPIKYYLFLQQIIESDQVRLPLVSMSKLKEQERSSVLIKLPFYEKIEV